MRKSKLNNLEAELEELKGDDDDDGLDVSISHHLIIEREDAKARDGWTIERDATPEQDDISASTAEEGDWVVAEPDDGPAVDTELSKNDS